MTAHGDPRDGKSLALLQGEESLEPIQGDELMATLQSDGSPAPPQGDKSLAPLRGDKSLAPPQGDKSVRKRLGGVRLPPGASASGTLFPRDYDVASADTVASEPAAYGSFDTIVPDVSCLPPREGSAESIARGELSLEGVLGEGGMGCVFFAEQRSLARRVAVKVLRPVFSKPEHVEILLAEARVTGGLEHPNVVPVHFIGTDDRERPVLVMRQVEGVPWSALVRDAAHPFWERLSYTTTDRLEAHVGILIQVCNALQYAHSRSIIHRDIKPDNVMVGAFGEVYVMDWGLAVPTEAGDGPSQHWRGPIGTPSYMPPELVLGDAVDDRTDVFLLGAVLHEILVGRPRHLGATLHEIFEKAAAPQAFDYPGAVPEELAALANRATAKDRDERPASVAEFRAALSDYLAHRGSAVLARAADVVYQRLEREPSDAVTFERSATECRFAYMQALQQWPENPQARRGLQKLLKRMLERAIDRGDAEAAAAYLAELPEADATLSERVETAKREARAREAAGARAHKLASELDATVSTRQRRWFLGALAALSVGWVVVYFAAWAVGYTPFTYTSTIAVALILAGFVAVSLVIGRRSLFRNQINRRVALLPVLATGTLLLHRIFGAVREVPVALIVADDLLGLGVLGMAAAILVRRAYAWTGAAFFAGGIVSMIEPAWTQPCFTVFGALGLLTMFWLWWNPPRESLAPTSE